LPWRSRVIRFPPGAVYSPGPPPYPPGGYPADYRRGPGAPDYDSLDDDEAPNGRNSAALPPPGPVMSPDDPRYGRPMGAPPIYSDRGPVVSPDDPRYGRPAAPPSYSDRGPILSPNDPRYGRPDGPPPVIYSDRPGGPPREIYSDRGSYSNDDIHAVRPPEAVGGPPGAVTGSVPPPVGADGKPIVLSALPPDERPEVAPAQLAPNLRRQEVTFPTKEPAGTLIVDTPNTYLYYVLGGGRAIRYGVRVGRDGFTWTGVQKISRKAEWPDWHPPPEMIDRQPYLPRFMAGGPGNPLGARAMYLGNTVYRNPRHQPALDHRQVRLVGLHRHAERGRLGSVRSREGRQPRGGNAWRRTARHGDGFRAAGTGACRRRARANAGRRYRHAADRGAAAARAGDGALGGYDRPQHHPERRAVARLFLCGCVPTPAAAAARP